MSLTFGSLFAGIGGIDLGLERAGMTCKWQVEIDPYCQKILGLHWPTVPRFGDIKEVTADELGSVDVVAGGFPCQPVSLAGRGKAQADERWLWGYFADVVRMVRPRYVLVENVPGLTNRGLGIVLGDLAEMGFDAEWQVVSAASQGAPHLRERLFVVAYSDSSGLQGLGSESAAPGRGRPSDRGAQGGGAGTLADAHGEREPQQGGTLEQVGRRTGDRGEQGGPGDVADAQIFTERTGLQPNESPEQWWRRSGYFGSTNDDWAVEPDVGRVAYGVPNRLDRLKALGNAVVPQCAEYVGRLILEHAGEQYCDCGDFLWHPSKP